MGRPDQKINRKSVPIQNKLDFDGPYVRSGVLKMLTLLEFLRRDSGSTDWSLEMSSLISSSVMRVSPLLDILLSCLLNLSSNEREGGRKN